jgi:hypothetical protein
MRLMQLAEIDTTLFLDFTMRLPRMPRSSLTVQSTSRQDSAQSMVFRGNISHICDKIYLRYSFQLSLDEQDESLELKMIPLFNSAPLPDRIYLLILNYPWITRDLSDDTEADVGNIGGFSTLNLVEQHPLRHDENDGPVLVDLGVST